MSDYEPGVMPQEIINLPVVLAPEIKKRLMNQRDKFKECMKPILVDRESVDPRVLEVEEQMHNINRERAASYGRKYTPPTIFYIDRMKGIEKSLSINADLQSEGFSNFNESAAFFHEYGNFIIVSVNGFDDKDVDGYFASVCLRHELSHAGSVRKHRVYSKAIFGANYETYRLGANLLRRRTGVVLGKMLDEGMHAVEDKMFVGEYPELLSQDPYLKKLPGVNQFFPGAKEKYDLLTKEVRQQGLLETNRILSAYKFRANRGDGVSALSYDDYSNLMLSIFSRNPELYKLAIDFVYGDKMLPFARQIEKTFGRGSFEKLMLAKDWKDARKLKTELAG
jgi:hypothetical protein